MKANKEKLQNAREEVKDGEHQVSNAELAAKSHKQEEDDAESSDGFGHEQSEYNDRLANEIEFSDEEDDLIENGMVELRNASKYLAYVPPNRDKNKRN